jgi:hypothetical protein
VRVWSPRAPAPDLDALGPLHVSGPLHVK